MTEAETKANTTSTNDPWEDRSLLKEQYIDERKSTIEIAEEWGCAPNTVRDRLKKFDIPIRSRSEAVSAGYGNHPKEVPMHVKRTGAVRWNYSYEDEKRTVFVHRLLAVAIWGFDAVADHDVHHKNEIRWDNRPANLELMGHGQHSAHHHLKIIGEERQKVADLYEHTDRSSYDIAQEYDICAATVRWIHEEKYDNE